MLAGQETLEGQSAVSSSLLLQLRWSSHLALAFSVQWPSDYCHWDVPPEVHLTTCCALLSPGRARRVQPLHLSPPPGVWRRRAHANVPAVWQRHLCQSLCGPSDQSKQMFWWVNNGLSVCLLFWGVFAWLITHSTLGPTTITRQTGSWLRSFFNTDTFSRNLAAAPCSSPCSSSSAFHLFVLQCFAC